MTGLSGTGSSRIPAARDFSHERRLHKEYITNDNFTVYVAGKEDEIMKAAEALQRPVFPVYLGRKCCPPAQPVFGGLVDI